MRRFKIKKVAISENDDDNDDENKIAILKGIDSNKRFILIIYDIVINNSDYYYDYSKNIDNFLWNLFTLLHFIFANFAITYNKNQNFKVQLFGNFVMFYWHLTESYMFPDKTMYFIDVWCTVPQTMWFY